MRLFFALPLLFAACALSAQETTVTPTTGRVLTLTAQVTIPENPQGVLLSLRSSDNNAFDLYLNGSQENNAGFYIYSGNAARGTAFNNQTFTVTPGSKTLTLAYATDGENAPVEGVRLWIDGTLIYTDTGLKWSNNGAHATRITIGRDVRTTPTDVLEGLVVESTPILMEGSVPEEGAVPNPAPRLTANAGSCFSTPTVDLDGTVTIGATPISLTGVSANTFAVTLDAELPEGANGTLIGWQVKNGNTHYTGQAERNAAGEPLRHSGTTTIATDPKVSPSTGRHIWTLTYDGSNDGARLYEDGALIAHAESLKWSNKDGGYPVTQITIGDSVSEQPGPFAGMKVYAAHVTMGSATAPENAMTALYEVPEELSKVGEEALYHLMTQNGKAGDFTVPAVTLNGEPLAPADAARALWLFDKSGPFTEAIDLAWNVSELTLSNGTVTLATTGDQPVHGVLSVLEKAALNDTWQRVKATQSGNTLTVPADDASAFYTIRAEEEAHEPGPVVSLDPAPAAGEGMPSQVFPPTNGTETPATATLFNFALDGAFEELGENQRTGLTLTLEGNGLVVGGEYTLTVDGKAYTATLEPIAAARAYALPHPAGTLTFTGFSLTDTSTVSLSGPVVAGQVTVTKSSWGVPGQSTRIAATLADDLVKDGFVDKDVADQAGPNSDLAKRQYRIPALATDGQGGVLAVYDVRYGGADLGVDNNDGVGGIDLGENFSDDGGTTWTKPKLAIDVENYFRKDGTVAAAYSLDLDIGDASILFDPAKQQYWLIAMTGGGLQRGYANTDCVLYTRGAAPDATWGKRTSVKETIAKTLEEDYDVTIVKTGSNHNGFLGGPGHGIVTRVGREGMPAGTLVFPIQCFVNNNTGAAQCAALYSTDNGATWNVTGLTPRYLAEAPHNAQENCIMELDDGSWLMMSKGGNWDQGRRLFFRTTDFKTWKQLASINNVVHVQGSCLRIGEVDGKSRYVMAHQIDPNTRCKLALIFGTDASDQDLGVDWDLDNPVMIFQGDTGNKGYVSLCLIDATTLGILYEANSKIYFERFDLSPYLR